MDRFGDADFRHSVAEDTNVVLAPFSPFRTVVWLRVRVCQGRTQCLATDDQPGISFLLLKTRLA